MDKKSMQRLLSIAIAFLLFILQGFSLVIVAAENSYDMDVIQSGLEEKGVLRVGMEANYAPFNWSQTSVTDNAIEISNSPGEYANGYDLQIAVHLEEELDLELEIVKLEWDGLPPALESGMIDAIIAGMTHFQSMRFVVLPQAIRSALPDLGNEFVVNIKDTSVLNVIAVTELFFITRSAAGSTYLTFQTFFIASVLYFVMTFISTRLLSLLEKRLNGADSYTLHLSSTMPIVEKEGDSHE